MEPISLPPVVVITATEAAYYAEACIAFKSIGEEDAHDLDEVTFLYPGLTEASACDWAIYGFTVQGWLNFESELNRIANYNDKLRFQIEYLKKIIKGIEDIIAEDEGKIKDEFGESN